jgi:hypothetical protein
MLTFSVFRKVHGLDEIYDIIFLVKWEPTSSFNFIIIVVVVVVVVVVIIIILNYIKETIY